MKGKKAESAIGMGRHLSMLAVWGLSIGVAEGKRYGRPRRKIRLEHVNLFAFVGQFCLLSSEARDAIGAQTGPESRRDITFGGVGVALDF